MRNEGSAKIMGCSDTTSGRKVVDMVACDFPVGFGNSLFIIHGMMVRINFCQGGVTLEYSVSDIRSYVI